MSDHQNAGFKNKFPHRYIESSVDYFEGCMNPVDFLRESHRDQAFKFMNDFISACQLADCLRSIHDTAVVVVPGDADYTMPPEVIAIILKEDNNGSTVTYSKFLLPWKSDDLLVPFD